jgi:hypothetical protein
LYINTVDKLNRFFDLFFKIIILFAFIISIKQLGELLNLFPGGQVSSIIGIPLDPSIPLFDLDNNFGIIPVIMGIITLIYILINTDSRFKRFLYNALLILFWCSLFFSGSRRGLILLCLITFLLILIQPFRLAKGKMALRRLAARSSSFLVGILLITSLSLVVAFHTSNGFKNRTLKSIGCKNLLDTKVKIADIIYRYSYIYNKSGIFPSYYNAIWTPSFDPYDPESSWGTRNHKILFPISGKNAEIVPIGAKGYLMDSTCNCSFAGGYCDSYSLLVSLNVVPKEKISASVYCYVSDDFDGQLVRLSVGTDFILNNKVIGNPVAIYDLEQKGSWKILKIDFECAGGNIPIFVSFVKNGVINLKKMKGYVVFAYPNYNHGNTGLSYLPDNNVTHNSTSEKNKKNYEKAGLLSFLHNDFLLANIQSSMQDPIRKFASGFVSEDTTYHGFRHPLSIDKGLSYSGSERVIRWQFALQIFRNEYDWKKKIFGGGFNFLNWYGYYFLKDKTASDWPHNPFLSILLYSGIMGLLIYCFFIYKVFYYYLKYRREYPLLLLFFLITFFFTFFSGGSPFDPPIMGFFVILPFFIHSVYKRGSEVNKITEASDE